MLWPGEKGVSDGADFSLSPPMQVVREAGGIFHREAQANTSHRYPLT